MITKRQQAEQLASQIAAYRIAAWSRLIGKCDDDAWQKERERHTEFFNGMTPKQEYNEHIKRRNAQEEKI